MKAVVFDFDGTLSYNSPNCWRKIWKDLGYDISKDSYYFQLYSNFISGKIDYQKWCDLTCDMFAQKEMKEDMIREVAKEIKLIKGFESAIKTLYDKGVSLHIVSGGIKNIWEEVMGEKTKYFDSINANQFVFDKKGMLLKIEATEFDFLGKAKFLENYIQEKNCNPKDVFFVGNSDNDEKAYLSGCNTICLNPENTDGNNRTIWTKTIISNNLESILEHILPEYKGKFKN